MKLLKMLNQWMRCWKKFGSRYLSNRSSNLTELGFQFTSYVNLIFAPTRSSSLRSGSNTTLCNSCWSLQSAAQCQNTSKSEPCTPEQLDSTMSKMRSIHAPTPEQSLSGLATNEHPLQQYRCFTLSASSGNGESKKVFYAKGCTTMAGDLCAGWAKEKSATCTHCAGNNCNAAPPMEMSHNVSAKLNNKTCSSSNGIRAGVINSMAIKCRNCLSTKSFDECDKMDEIVECNATIVNANHETFKGDNPTLQQGNWTEFKCFRMEVARLYPNNTETGLRGYARGCTFLNTTFCSGWVSSLNVTSCTTCTTDNCDQNPPTVATTTVVPGQGTTTTVVPGQGTTTTVVPGQGTTTTVVPGQGTTTTKKPNGAGTVTNSFLTSLGCLSILLALAAR
uniref:Uncharacterized protein n=1 Tax=Anopheles minimus TaxID=112268 RepID=A0A182WCU3_9DIPT